MHIGMACFFLHLLPFGVEYLQTPHPFGLHRNPTIGRIASLCCYEHYSLYNPPTWISLYPLHPIFDYNPLVVAVHFSSRKVIRISIITLLGEFLERDGVCRAIRIGKKHRDVG